MRTISLKDFCLTGQFGDVKIGMTICEVINILGTPDSTTDFGTGWSGILYAWYEFIYLTDTEVLTGIQNDSLNHPHRSAITYKNDKFKIDKWLLKVGRCLTYKQVIDILEKDGIKFKELIDKFGNDVIEFESGVRLDFVHEDDFITITFEIEGDDVRVIDKKSPSNLEVIKNKDEKILIGIRLLT